MPFKRALLQTKQPPLKYGSDCQHFKDFYESIRKSGKELVSRADILKQKIEKREKEVNRSKKALSIAEKNRLDK